MKVFGFDQWFKGDTRNLFARFHVTTGDDFVVCLVVIALGVIIGTIGSAVGLRRFLRV